ncbi:hypothetical protein MEO93_29925, partial [Dolichospermum sp. ST_sed3]|nr:hypothetical protein [Dolichospermum sp. ST_sed3]
EGFYKSVGDFEIEEKTIWVKKDNLIFKIALSGGYKVFKDIKTYKNLTKTDKEIPSIHKLRNTIYFKTNKHFYKYSQNSNVFYEDKIAENLFKSILDATITREDNYGNIWYTNTHGLSVLMKKDKDNYTNVSAPFLNLTQDLVFNNLSVNTVNSENIFIGLTEGLAHYNSKSSKDFMIKPKVFIRSFSALKDTLYFGNGKISAAKYKIPFGSNYVRFTFASPTYENIENIKFSYLLDGFDDNWSNWSTSSLKEYTNLREGNYTMKVRVKNSYGIQSDEATFPFTISPPWYRHF